MAVDFRKRESGRAAFECLERLQAADVALAAVEAGMHQRPHELGGELPPTISEPRGDPIRSR